MKCTFDREHGSAFWGTRLPPGVRIVHPGWSQRTHASDDDGVMSSPLATLTRCGLGAAAAGFLACAALAPAAHAANTTLSTELRPTPVSAWSGTIAWSSYDAAANNYRLVVSRDGGPPQPLAVAPSPAPFDVDLGTNRNGSTYAVYTRCATPAAPDDDDRRGTDCDVYRTSVATGVEQHLTSISAPAWDERDPTIMRGEIAFIRRETHGGTTKDVLRIANTTSGSQGTRQLTKVTVGRSTALRDPELAANRVAYVRTGPGFGFGEQQLHTLTLRGLTDRTVYTARSGGANAANIAGLSVSDTLKSFVWARTNNGSGTGNRLVRLTISNGQLTYAQGSSRYISSAWASPSLGAAVSVDGSGTGTCFGNVNDPPSATQCSIQVTGPVTWFASPSLN